MVAWALQCMHRTNISDRAGHKRTPFTQSCTTFAITRGSALSIAKCCSSLVYIIPSCASRVHQSLPGPGRFYYKMCLVSSRCLHRIFFSSLWFLVTCGALPLPLPLMPASSPYVETEVQKGLHISRSVARPLAPELPLQTLPSFGNILSDRNVCLSVSVIFLRFSLERRPCRTECAHAGSATQLAEGRLPFL